MAVMRRIVSIVLMVILLLSGWLVYQNWNTIDAFIHSLGTTVEQTEKELEENKKILQKFIDEDDDIVVRDLTEEEAKALNSGNLSEEEVIEILTGREPEEKPVKTPKPIDKPSKPNFTPKPTSTPESTSQDKISQLIAKLYVQKALYLNKLDDIEAQVRAEFLATPNKWGTKADAKKVLLNKYLPTVAEWEKNCDTMVYGILDEIREEIKKTGKDEAVVDTIKISYLEEKKLKKAYFINRYMD